MARFRHYPWPLLGAALLIIALGGLSACSTPMTSFEPKSDAAERTHAIYILFTWAAGLVGAAVLAAMVYIMVRFRARPGRVASQTHGNHTLEMIWTVAPVALLVLIGIPSILALVEATRAPDDDAIRIVVTGHQWWWEVEYQGLGPEGGPLVTANELHLPIGQQVAITLISDDVIHSFWVPQLVGKADVIPGRITPLEPFTPKEVGLYYGQCAEYCGTAHALMRFRVIVETLAEYELWLAALQAPPDPPVGPAILGQALFTGTCGRCHAVSGTLASGTVGPNLSRFGERTTLGAGILENTPENLQAWIRDLRDIKPVYEDDGGVRVMPAFGETLTDEQIASIAAYLQDMRVE
jgi:cytochrome c oxidase subunit 2